jgi:hypothetical protein
MALLSDGKFKVVTDCRPTKDAELKPLEAIEAALNN